MSCLGSGKQHYVDGDMYSHSCTPSLMCQHNTTDTHTFILHLGVDFRFFHSMYIYVYRPRTYMNIPVHVHACTYAKHSACYNVQVYNVRTCTLYMRFSKKITLHINDLATQL